VETVAGDAARRRSDDGGRVCAHCQRACGASAQVCSAANRPHGAAIDSDGRRGASFRHSLHARSAKANEKFPALLEYLPYRKDDATAARDYPTHYWFASHGYVSVRVDIRGFGTSEGVPTEREYSEQEQLDGEQVIAWLAAQPWSNGKVGMFGISWGGFNSIQMAMRHPPALKAILAVDATEQLFSR